MTSSLSHQIQPVTSADKSLTTEQWEARMNAIQPSREILNKLVMNFLVVEGYKEGAIKFQKEAGIKAEMDDELIDQRIEVRHLIERGEIEQAIKRIDQINDEILKKNPELYFELKRQQLVELIKQNKVTEAIHFAQSHLSSQCKNGNQFQAEVDKTMTLLMFEDLTKAPMHDLADQSHRQKLASQVNQAILKAQNHSSELKLEFYWKLLQYSQNQLANQGLEFPKMVDPLGGVIGQEAKEANEDVEMAEPKAEGV